MPKEHKELKYKVSFATPAFLGNADQQAQWRTPPFKALIRQWWRVVKAPEMAYDVAKLRAAENALFGTASDDGAESSHRSLVRLRLSAWDDGKLKDWPLGGQRVKHPEVGDGGRPVDAELYLGYGALEHNAQSHSTQLKSNGAKRTAIDEKSSVELRLMFPTDHEHDIRAAMQLAGWFGTLGSRSRNGWGALHVSEIGESIAVPLSKSTIAAYTRPLAICLKLEWPHAIGSDDNGPLVWRTALKATWRDAMSELARLKIAYRTQGAPFPDGRPDGTIQARHLIAYPVTNHVVNAWGNQARLANQIRFKVVKDGAQYVGVIVHLPCRMPEELVAQLRGAAIPAELAVWQSVHLVLDTPNNQLTRLA